MKDKELILSICIPTYNRADILDKTLNSITQDSAFDYDVEIVISDNCSQDHTPEICKKYTEKFSNVRYYRNQENVKDRNFLLVMSHANGRYLKILNDTASFKPGMLQYMKSMIGKYNEDCVLLFPSFSYFTKEVTVIEALNKNDVLYYLTYNATWTTTYGMWQTDLVDICDDCDFSSQLAQVVWIYKMAEKKPSILCFNDYFNVTLIKAKGDYNYMHVFVDNYLGILKSFKFKFCFYEYEKLRLLFMLSSFYYFMNISKTISYSSKGAFKTMYKEYWFEPYFYILFPLYMLLRFLYDVFLKKYRRRN